MESLIPNTLDDIQNKCYKMEEERGETFTWKYLKENFVKDFKFVPQDETLLEASN